MKSRFLRAISSKITAIIIILFGIISATVNYACRFGYVFIDKAVFMGFSFTLLCVLIGCICASIALLFLNLLDIKINEKPYYEHLSYRIIILVSASFVLLVSIIDIANLIVNKQNAYLIYLNIKETLPYVVAIVLILFFSLFFAFIKSNKIKKIIAISMAIICVLSTALTIFPIDVYKFTSSPVVFDTGSDYSVVFSTSEKGTGYVEYDYGGNHYIVYDAKDGKKNCDSIIHSINIPYEHLKGNSYNIGSTRVIEPLAYGSRLGKSIVSQLYTFNVPADKLEALVITDWHTQTKKAKKAALNVGDYNCLLLLGDMADNVNFDEQIAKYLIDFAGDLTSGSMPVVFVRGNHEARGTLANALCEKLGFKSFYYMVNLKGIDFVILDSGEDKVDEHVEYGGLNDFASYHTEMVNWLSGLNALDRPIVLSHNIELCYENELKEQIANALAAFDSSLVMGGHTHVINYIENGQPPTFEAGGYKNKEYICSKMVVLDETIVLTSYNASGETVFNKTIDR